MIGKTLSVAVTMFLLGAVAEANEGLSALQEEQGQKVTEPIVWHKNLRKAHEVSVEANKPMLVLFSSKSCRYCDKLEALTLAEAEVHKLIRQGFVAVKLDLVRDQKVAEILEVEAVPCTIVLTPEADLVGRITGFLEPDRYRLQLLKAKVLQDELQRVRQAGHTKTSSDRRS